MPSNQAVSHARLHRWYNDGPRQWGEPYMLKHLWRIKGMYDREDAKQDAFFMYLRCYRYHPGKSQDDIFRLYRKSLPLLLNTRSRQCFPNTHAYVEEQGRLVVEIEDHEAAFSTTNELEQCLDFFSLDLTLLPSELAGVLRLIIDEVFGGKSCIIQRRALRLNGKPRREPFSIAVARAAGIDRSRDPIEELRVALGIEESQ